jgi:hypothetical protein
MSASTNAWNDRLNEIEKQIAEAGIEFVRFEQTEFNDRVDEWERDEYFEFL